MTRRQGLEGEAGIVIMESSENIVGREVWRDRSGGVVVMLCERHRAEAVAKVGRAHDEAPIHQN